MAALVPAPAAAVPSPKNTPTKVSLPIPSDAKAVVEYINSFTLSGRTLTVNGTTPEDRALKWLVITDPFPLPPNSDTNKARLRQRFALLTLGFQPSSGEQVVLRTSGWVLSTANECDWNPYAGWKCENGQVTNFNVPVGIAGTLPPDLCWLTAMKTFTLSYSGIAGTLPTQLGWWTHLTALTMSGGSVQGTIPSSIGAWTALTYVSLERNKLSGTIPPTVAAWTVLQTASFYSNNLNGTMPEFGGGFCPAFGKGVDLFADCNNNTGRAKIKCECCNRCFECYVQLYCTMPGVWR
jgi:hypothetical protein